MTGPDERRLRAVPDRLDAKRIEQAVGSSASRRHAGASYAYPRNPLLHFTEGPDGRKKCTACGWVHGLCPYHKGFVAGATEHVVTEDDVPKWPTQAPRFDLQQALLFQGNVPCTVKERAWAGGGWHYVVIVGAETAITAAEHAFSDPDDQP